MPIFLPLFLSLYVTHTNPPTPPTSTLHYTTALPLQACVRMLIAKKELRRRLLSSVDDHVKKYEYVHTCLFIAFSVSAFLSIVLTNPPVLTIALHYTHRYAVMKIAAVLMLHFHRYVKDFRNRKAIRDRTGAYIYICICFSLSCTLTLTPLPSFAHYPLLLSQAALGCKRRRNQTPAYRAQPVAAHTRLT